MSPVLSLLFYPSNKMKSVIRMKYTTFLFHCNTNVIHFCHTFQLAKCCIQDVTCMHSTFYSSNNWFQANFQDITNAHIGGGWVGGGVGGGGEEVGVGW